jgi:hypothetical protein
MNLTPAERHLMEHTTGWHHEQRMYRNHFVTNESTDSWPVIQGLVARGLMLMSRAPSQLSGGDPVFAVTAAGIEALKALGQPEPTPATEPAPPPDAEPEQTGFDPFCPQCGSTEPDEDLCCDVCGVDTCHLADLRKLIAAHDAKRPAVPEPHQEAHWASECKDPAACKFARELTRVADAPSFADQGCRRPPRGWTCSRLVGHEGPCAAWPIAAGERPATPMPRVVVRADGWYCIPQPAAPEASAEPDQFVEYAASVMHDYSVAYQRAESAEARLSAMTDQAGHNAGRVLDLEALLATVRGVVTETRALEGRIVAGDISAARAVRATALARIEGVLGMRGAGTEETP